MPDFRVLALTDSFHAEWAGLAAAHGFALVHASEPGALEPRRASVTVVSAAGDEALLEGALRHLPRDVRFVAAIGAVADHRLAAAVVRAGADDYFALPQDLPHLTSWLRESAARIKADSDASAFANAERAKLHFDGILGDSPALHAALDRAARVIPRPSVTVLITGETGTG
ncbi:MAG TPA: hypothetical protein VFN38_00940, partial [Gemmatimonadaceae bacterium]|nr:hypothetical protein [Gemmatimonadaceae bacterium]